MKRRNFIKTTGSTVTLPMLLNGLPLSAMAKPSIFNSMNEDSDRVLVIIQLNGGNDGLNMIIPRDQYAGLADVRPNIMIPENRVLGLTDKVGVHPVMTGVKTVFDKEQLAVIQSVGYPNQNRSHFRSMDIWQTGSPADEFWTSGWLGRYLEGEFPDFPEGYPNDQHPHPFALTIGGSVSETCQGTMANFSMVINNPFRASQLAVSPAGELPDTPYGHELDFLRTSIEQTNAYAELIVEAAEMGNNMAAYPEANKLAERLKHTARLISGGLQTKIYIVSIGGFDTHANQVESDDPTIGNHANLLFNVSEAIRVFMQDLELLGIQDRVVGMTFSEFGRKIKSNDGFGTDHGTAAPMMVFGNCLNGQILGENPEVPIGVDKRSGVPMQYDFRDIYGSILQDWFELDEADVKELLYEGFTHIPLVGPCKDVTTSTTDWNLEPIEIDNHPNPFNTWTTIRFQSENERARLSIFDTMGNELRVLMDKKIVAGEHQVRFDSTGLPAGTYYYRLQLGTRTKTKRMVKI